MKRMRWLAAVLCFCLLAGTFGCGRSGTQVEMEPRVEMRWGTRTLPPVAAKTPSGFFSGSENQELEEILVRCADDLDIRIEMDYKGSIDIMRELQSGATEYDAVWPASSIWLSMGDEQHLVKHAASFFPDTGGLWHTPEPGGGPGLYAGRRLGQRYSRGDSGWEDEFLHDKRHPVQTPEPALISAFFTPFWASRRE